MSTLQILALAPTKAGTMEIADALSDTDCRIYEGYSSQDLGQILDDSKIDVAIFAGPMPGLSAEKILTAVTERAPGAVLVVALKHAGDSNALAAKFGGHALPWPLQRENLLRVLSKPQDTNYMVPRREPRFRVLAGATIEASGHEREGLLVNISNHGAMLLGEVPVKPGAKVSVGCKYGIESFHLSGTVKHSGENEKLGRMLDDAAWLSISNPYLFGVEFSPESAADARNLCRIVGRERNLLRLTVACIPGIPKGLAPVFKQLGIEVEMGKSLALLETAPPPILLIDVSTCSLDELRRLVNLRKRALVIGIATTPLTDPERITAAGTLPSIFVLPFHNDDLVHHIEGFFAPVNRKFPRLQKGFSAVLSDEGKNKAVDGIDVSLHGFAFRADEKAALGRKLHGRLSMDDAPDGFPFQGEVVYSIHDGEGFRTGVSMEVEKRASDGFRKYLSVRFLKELRVRWEHQLRTPPGEFS